jgi:hypothetical protein
MSTTVCPYPIIGAVREIDDVLGKNRVWHPAKDTKQEPLQLEFLKKFYAHRAVSELQTIPELEAIASFSAESINHWLAKRGSGTRLQRLPRGSFATACMLDVSSMWRTTGEVLRLPRMKTPGVILKQDVQCFTSKASPIDTFARVMTSSGDIVSMAPFSAKSTMRPFDLIAMVSNLNAKPCHDFEGVHFPMVDLTEEQDISWLQGMHTTDTAHALWYIAQSFQRTTFRMNQYGARAKSDAVVTVTRGMVHTPKPMLMIDETFLVWIQRRNLTHPLFVGYITPEAMRDPGIL